jgi:hypothetical protein
MAAKFTGTNSDPEPKTAPRFKGGQGAGSSPALDAKKEENKHIITKKTLDIVLWLLLTIAVGSFLIMMEIIWIDNGIEKDSLAPFVTLLSSIITGTVGLVAGHKLQRD